MFVCLTDFTDYSYRNGALKGTVYYNGYIYIKAWINLITITNKNNDLASRR